MKPVVIVIVVLLVLASALTGWLYYTGALGAMFGYSDAAVVEGSVDDPLADGGPVTPIYLPLDPPFLVNFEMEGTLRFLQVSMEVMSLDESAIEDVRQHMPYVRNNLLLTLSEQTLETMASAEAKDALREKLLKEVRFVLTQVTGRPGIEALYFTSFVMQ